MAESSSYAATLRLIAADPDAVRNDPERKAYVVAATGEDVDDDVCRADDRGHVDLMADGRVFITSTGRRFLHKKPRGRNDTERAIWAHGQAVGAAALAFQQPGGTP